MQSWRSRADSGSLSVPVQDRSPGLSGVATSWASFHAPASRVVVEERPRPCLPAQAPGSKKWTIPGCWTADVAVCGCESVVGAIEGRSTAARTVALPLAARACEQRVGVTRERNAVGGAAHVVNGACASVVATWARYQPSRITVPRCRSSGSNGLSSNATTRRSPIVIASSTLAVAISAVVPCPTSFVSTFSSIRVVETMADPVRGRRLA